MPGLAGYSAMCAGSWLNGAQRGCRRGVPPSRRPLSVPPGRGFGSLPSAAAGSPGARTRPLSRSY